jgi:hypothetical protein
MITIASIQRATASAALHARPDDRTRGVAMSC